MRNGEYRAFISKAFIEPLRSVLIVDDDYPTFEDMLTSEDSRSVAAKIASEKEWHIDIPRVRELLRDFRSSDPPLIVDIHDGYNVKAGGEAHVAEHLHQSDLLVLDFQLDKKQVGDGSKAIAILRSLFSNDHFNLVVLHSKDELADVFNDVLIGLLSPIGPFLSQADRDAVVEKIAEREDEDPDLLRRLEATIGEPHYFAFVGAEGADRKWPLPARLAAPPTAAFVDEAVKAGFARVPDQRPLALYLLERREAAMSARMSKTPFKGLEWSKKGRSWIRTDSGFVAFSRKQDRKNLIDELLLALESWNPPPSRLFLAHLRASLDRAGVPAESKALGNKLVLARWYRDLLDADHDMRRFSVGESVQRHADLLMREVLPSVADFAEKMVRADSGESATVVCDRYFGFDLADPRIQAQADDEHNAFICTKPPGRRHLETGHVFEAEGDVWVCLTPLCDLVPGRRKKGSKRHGKMDGVMPFIAVRLHSVGVEAAKPTSNRYIFLKLDNGVKAFTMGVDEGANPHWFNLYAVNEGRFKNGGFSYRRIELNSAGVLAPKSVRAKIVAQLQYEYALNLIQRLGFSMTRVGLDFVGRAGTVVAADE